jgi:hypothetical protein
VDYFIKKKLNVKSTTLLVSRTWKIFSSPWRLRRQSSSKIYFLFFLHQIFLSHNLCCSHMPWLLRLEAEKEGMTFSHLKKVSVCFGEEKNTDGVSKLCKDILPSHRAPYSLFPIEINKKNYQSLVLFQLQKKLVFWQIKGNSCFNNECCSYRTQKCYSILNVLFTTIP